MTALRKYQRLECPGLWRDRGQAQRRDVVVKFGEASLVLSDPRSEMALTHWSLPAVARINPGETPALYSPGADAAETLEIDDPSMMAALETVQAALAAGRPHPGRLRGSILVGLSVLVVAIGILWVPKALIDHTASVLPQASRAAIGDMALADLVRLTGTPCAGPRGVAAADGLATRLFGADAPQIVVLRTGVETTLHLPAAQIVVAAPLLERLDGPEALAGYLLAEALRMQAEDPVLPLLRYAGVRASFGLLTTGVLSEDALDGHAEALLSAGPQDVPDSALIAAFAAAEVASTPYAYARDPGGESVLGLIEADPWRSGSPRPVMTDGDWISLQGICAEQG